MHKTKPSTPKAGGSGVLHPELRAPELRRPASSYLSSSALQALVHVPGLLPHAPGLRWPQRTHQVQHEAGQFALFSGSSASVLAPSETAPQLVHCIDQDYNNSNTSKEARPIEVSRVARITRKGVLVYGRTTGGKGNPEALARGRAQLIEGGFPGSWSDKSKKKVRGIVSAWLDSRAALRGDAWTQTAADLAGQAYSLLTLTLCANQLHTDQEVRRLMLMPFLQDLKRKHQVGNYMWFAEKQANGNIHFHAILDKFVPWASARALWNKAQQGQHYVERYRAARQAWHAGGFRYDATDSRPEKQQFHAYEEGVRTNWSQPPTTDIRQVKGAAAVVAYVVEYCSKGLVGPVGSEKTKLNGRLWGCNRELSKLARFEVEVSTELDRLLRHETEAGNVQKVEGERWAFYRGPVAELLAFELPALFHGYRAHWRAQALTLPSRRRLRRAARQEARKRPSPALLGSLPQAGPTGSKRLGSASSRTSKSQSSAQVRVAT